MRLRTLLIATAGVITVVAAGVVVVANALAETTPVVVATYDFEDGTTQGWVARGAATLAAVTDAAHGGSYSLATTGRTASWNGPGRGMDGLLQKGATYLIEASVRMTTGSPAVAVNMTMQRTPDGASTTYERVAGAATVTDAAWVQLSGEYSYQAVSSGMQLYLESPDATAGYYVDDVKITMTAPSPDGPLDQAGLTTDFETGTAQGWKGRITSETLAVTTADAHAGTYSLLTTNRTQTYAGPALNLLGRMSKGNKYILTAWAKLAPGEAAGTLRMSLERRTSGTPTYETLVGNTAVAADSWVKFSNSYTLAADVDFLSVYLESVNGTPSFYIDDFALEYVKPVPIQTEIPSVKDVIGSDFKIGTAITPPETLGVHSQLLLKHFNSITAGNAMKWDATEPAEGQFRWTDADTLANYAAANGLGLRGHTLLWHNQTPAWVFQHADGTDLTSSAEDKALLLTRLENHIRAVVGRYGDKVYAWDVANEVIDESQADGLRRSKWYTITGLDFLRTAFTVAREVAPASAKLCINDYNTEQPRKREALYTVVSQLLAEGVPVDCVGHQMHINVEQPSIENIESTITRFAGLPVDQQVTELDMSVYTNSTDSYTSVPASLLAQQGYRYRDVFDVFRRQKSHLSSVTLWGLADDNTWLKTFPKTRLDLPLLFDEQLQAKPAYWGVVDPSKLPPLIRQLTVPGASIRVDGDRDQEWSKLPDIRFTAASGLAAGFQLRWSGKQLTVVVDVADATSDKADAVELFVDGNNAKATAYDSDDRHYKVQRDGTRTKGLNAQAKRISGGYRVEAALPLANAGAIGDKIGFDIRVKDAHSGGATMSWNDATNGQDSDASRWGTLTLIDPVRQADVPKTATAPVIDGVADATIWDRAAEITTGVQVSGTGGASAKAKLLWDTGHLYLLVTVTDPVLDESGANAYEQDSIEIFVDPDNGKTAGYGDGDGQYRVSFSNKLSVGGTTTAGSLVSATKIIDGGYVVEASIALTTITPASGALVGFDLQVNDAAGGTRASVLTWQDPTGLSYVNTSRWGVLRLVCR